MDKKDSGGKVAGWIIWFAVLVLSAYIIPFGLLSGIAHWYGAFLYWTIFALAAVVSLFIFMQGWRD